jgi:hypothetical protein
MLVECTVTMAVLTILGLLLLKMALNITTPRQWTLYQSLTDAYMTYEKAYAQRASFAQLTSNASAWPISPATSSNVVEVGRLPGGQIVNGTVIRTRFADPNNYPDKGGSISAANAALVNPGKVEVWKLQSILTYTVNKQTYRKVRTVVRTQ